MTAAELMDFWTRRDWSIDRRIEDLKSAAASGAPTSFRGSASFGAEGREWIYTERGFLQTPDRSYVAVRGYRYAIEQERLRVSFADGRYFHTISLAPSGPNAALDCPRAYFDHRCGEDLYRGHLEILPEGWTTEWRVQGPRKDLKIVTVYR